MKTSSKRGHIALMVGHCAGMVDLVALPVWVGTLISRYGLDPQQAGMLATLFLAGAVVASLLLAPKFQRLNGRLVATLGFGVAAAAFFGVSMVSDFGSMAALHGLAGFAAGSALSVTHGTIARSERPHRLFAIVGTALGVFGIIFMGSTPPLVAAAGGPMLFVVFAGVMAVGALAALLAFPVADPVPAGHDSAAAAKPLSAAVWFGVVGIGCMALVQAMTFSFLERVGSDRGFGLAAITGVLIALGVVSMIPAPLAAMLEKRLPARSVMMAGAAVQAMLVAVIMNSPAFAPYAMAASVFAAVMIFTHTFAFGLIASLDLSGRALAATPAMVMIGAAIGPILGGTLVKASGYSSLSIAALVMACVAVFCFSRIPVAKAAPQQGVAA
ncbi:MFS transporter [Hydrogenophaga crassostreae]|uniref:MFS transporter n=1 Tax=Hydrogenophaga crassostreae TaxID=1763535 RepID=A0A167HJE4_9BURK|nr:MFS transporter [Hydrogenophaga crassostreae]OAD41295.1 MFS transporter [Hydrogenophaga crassostreae]